MLEGVELVEERVAGAAKPVAVAEWVGEGVAVVEGAVAQVRRRALRWDAAAPVSMMSVITRTYSLFGTPANQLELSSMASAR